jgi:hypothetical protein
MPFSIRVRDFQSIEDATIEVAGLTVVTGQNNGGKTALIRSVFGAFTNARGTKFVRHGKDSTQVGLSFSDGRSLLWEKGEKVNRYELDGKKLNRVGQGVPPEIETLGVTAVEAAGVELWPQFAHQFVGQVFLLDKPGSLLAEAVANVDKVGVLNESLRLATSDRRSAASELKVRLEDVGKIEDSLLRFGGLDEAVSHVRKVGVIQTQTVEDQKSLDLVLEVRTRWVSLTGARKALLPVRTLPTVDEALVGRVGKMQKAIEWAVPISIRVKRVLVERERAALAAKAARSVVLPDPQPIAEAHQCLGMTQALSSRVQRAKKERDQASGAATAAKGMVLPDPQPVRDALQRLEAAKAMSRKLAALRGTVDDLRATLAKTQAAHSDSAVWVESLFNEAGQCPFCGAAHETSCS